MEVWISLARSVIIVRSLPKVGIKIYLPMDGRGELSGTDLGFLPKSYLSSASRKDVIS